jgi:cytochrome c5
MQDEGVEHAHATPIKTPQQLLVVLALAFIVPIIGIIMLTQLIVTAPKEPAAFAPEAIAKRIEPVARVEVGGGAAGAAKSGEEVVKSSCVVCHQAGLLNAPKIGDRAAWAPRIKEGLDTLVKEAINGVRAMPPRGGNPNLSDLEVMRAVVYMANQSGANFKEPAAPAEAPKATASAAAPTAAVQQPAMAPAAVATAPAAAATPANAAAEDLLQKSGCLACHAVDKKVLGPSYKEVAAKYAGDPSALDKLTKKIKAGGAGTWGTLAMPPHPQLSEADIATMVKYVLSQK